VYLQKEGGGGGGGKFKKKTAVQATQIAKYPPKVL